MSELLEKILDKRNVAYKKVCANKGAGGVDGMETYELDGYIRENWDSIKEQIRERSYKLQPVKRVEIPKPNGSKSMTFATRIKQLNWTIRGWINYFALGSMKKQ